MHKALRSLGLSVLKAGAEAFATEAGRRLAEKLIKTPEKEKEEGDE